jgi:hypothetical protein
LQITRFFNPQNDAQDYSFDDLFFKRMFSSYIVQESNAYNNRAISDYTIGLESMLEAERIKESIFNYEQDLGNINIIASMQIYKGLFGWPFFVNKN